jgi:hypothetical protein
MINTVIIGLVGAVFGALISFFVTTLTQRKMFSDMASHYVSIHEKIHHKDNMYEHVEGEIVKHKTNCGGSTKIDRIEKLVTALIIQLGGKIEDVIKL